MKDHNPVSWFEVRKDSVRFRTLKWTVAILSALFLNWLYIEGLPASQGIRQLVETQPEEDVFEIELAEPEEEFEYVETNPESLENEPDDTNNISDRTQQAAQENVAGPQNNPTPFLKGDDEESPKIVEGEMPVQEQGGEPVQVYSGQPGNPSPESQEPHQQEPQPHQSEQLPQPDRMPSIDAPFLQELPQIAPPPPTPEFIDEVEPVDDIGVDLQIIKKPENEALQYSEQDGEDRTININIPPSVAEALSKAIEAQKALQEQEQQEHQEQPRPNTNTRPQPSPRPRLSPKILPGPLLNSQVYAARMGVIGFDAKFTQFGYYLQRMFDTIQMQWYSLLSDVTIGQEKRPSSVIVEFTLDKNGSIVQSEVLETDAGQLATILCNDAVESRAPFGFWTEQMVDQLGDQTNITLKFIYL